MSSYDAPWPSQWWNSDGLPVGVHLMGRFGDEATLLRLAGQVEEVRPWTTRWPAVSGVHHPTTQEELA